MSSVLGKRPAEGSLDNEPEAKQARPNDIICSHPNPDVYLIYNNEKVRASKAILMSYFDTFAEYFATNNECKEYKFDGSNDEWKTFLRMIEDTYSLRYGFNNIRINVINLDVVMLKLYHKYKLKSIIIKTIINKSINEQLDIVNSSFYPKNLSKETTEEDKNDFDFATFNIPFTTVINDPIMINIQVQLDHICKIRLICNDWKDKEINDMLDRCVKFIIRNIYNSDNHIVIYKFIIEHTIPNTKNWIRSFILDKFLGII